MYLLLVKSDTAWPTYLPENLTSNVNSPLTLIHIGLVYTQLGNFSLCPFVLSVDYVIQFIVCWHPIVNSFGGLPSKCNDRLIFYLSSFRLLQFFLHILLLIDKFKVRKYHSYYLCTYLLSNYLSFDYNIFAFCKIKNINWAI